MVVVELYEDAEVSLRQARPCISWLWSGSIGRRRWSVGWLLGSHVVVVPVVLPVALVAVVPLQLERDDQVRTD